MTYLARSTKRVYTLKDGTYTGMWYGARCYIYDKTGCIIQDIDTVPILKGHRKKVTVIVDCPQVKIFSLP